MKKYLLLAVVSFIISAQDLPAQLFQNFIGTASAREFARAVAKNGNYFMVAGRYRLSYYGKDHPALIRYNSNGTLNFAKRINTPGGVAAEPYDIEAVKNASGGADGYIMLMYVNADIVVARLTNGGTITWAVKLYTAASEFARKVKPIYSGTTLTGFYVVANRYQEGGLLIKLTPSGTIDWQTRVESGYTNYEYVFNDIALTSDGGCVVAGWLTGANSYSALFKFSNTGALSWSKYYDFFSTPYAGARCVAVVSDGYVVSGGDANQNLTFKTNTSGVVQWAYKYTATGITYTEPYDLTTDSKGNIILAGPVYSIYPIPANIIKLNSTGSVLFGSKYEYNTPLYDIDMDGAGYVAVGSANESNTAADIYLIKTNSLGAITSACPPTALSVSRQSPEYISQPSASAFRWDDSLLWLKYNLSVTSISTEQEYCGSNAPPTFAHEADENQPLTGTFKAFADLAGLTLNILYNNVEYANADKYEVALYNNTGSLLSKKILSPNQLIKFSMINNTAGLYMVVLIKNGVVAERQHVVWVK